MNSVKNELTLAGTLPRSATAQSKAKATVERRLRRGKRLVMGGFGVASAGVVGYCLACFGASVNQEIGVSMLENPRWLVVPALGVIGLGTLLWLVGSFVYLSAAMDSDPQGPDIHF